MAEALCSRCGAPKPTADAECPACGYRPPPLKEAPAIWADPGRRRVALWVGMLLLVVFLIGFIWWVATARRTPLNTPPDVRVTSPPAAPR